ncbi:DUF397 domain-containing protein [Streptomyces sp. NRRL F-5135]|uniref:DUF397 domain-containing protein n=1 Tax=Streptomyces sp. NRRL F-5135 TaxID=1463858 RepID=UPI0004C6DFCA|nr:DUF397 domain-containing protein [Streptomyces sp. NRRL F-5135]
MRRSEQQVPEAGPLQKWRKSSHSGPSNGDCLEVADGHPTVPVRDSKNARGPVLVFHADGWSSFVSAVKRGELA